MFKTIFHQDIKSQSSPTPSKKIVGTETYLWLRTRWSWLCWLFWGCRLSVPFWGCRLYVPFWCFKVICNFHRKAEIYLIDTNSPLQEATVNKVTPWSSIRWNPTPWSDLRVAHATTQSTAICEVKLKILMETHKLLGRLPVWRNKLCGPCFLLCCACFFSLHFSVT